MLCFGNGFLPTWWLWWQKVLFITGEWEVRRTLFFNIQNSNEIFFQGDSQPQKVFDRHASLASCQIINYRCKLKNHNLWKPNLIVYYLSLFDSFDKFFRSVHYVLYCFTELMRLRNGYYWLVFLLKQIELSGRCSCTQSSVKSVSQLRAMPLLSPSWHWMEIR